MPIPPRLGFLQAPIAPLVKPMFRTLAVAASGLSAQRARMETVAGNIANAETTRTEDGTPYRRRVVTMAPRPMETVPYASRIAGVPPLVLPPGELPPFPPGPSFDIAGVTIPDQANGVTVAGVVEDLSEGPLVYEPGHPDADANGYVRYPNVRITDEMVDLMDSRRVFEANATVFQAAKAMLRRSLDI